MTYDRTFNIISTDTMAKRSSNTNTHSRKRMSNKTVLEKMNSTTIKELHEEWAVKNGYQENDILNSKNSIIFKDGAER